MLKQSFPQDIAQPQLLFDFAAWLSERTKRETEHNIIKTTDAFEYVPAGIQIENGLTLFSV